MVATDPVAAPTGATMKVGLIARDDHTGLAVQTSEFWKHMKPHKTLVIQPTWMGAPQAPGTSVRYSQEHGALYYMDSKPYPESAMVRDPVVDHFLDELDIVFTCETPYNFWIFERARERGVKTVLQYNFEFLEWLLPSLMPQPDLFAAPSLWRYDDVRFDNKVYLPVPVNRDALPYRRRTELRTILHTAGIGAIHDRNGSKLLLAAMELLPGEVDVRLHIHSQTQLVRIYSHTQGRVDPVTRTAPHYTDLYGGDEDAYFIPRKFGGLCLPMNEAAACGMPVIMTDVPPQDDILPGEARIPAKLVDEFMARAMIQVHEADPVDIAGKIVELYHNPELVEQLSDASNVYADSISWANMKSKYEDVFQNLL